MYYEIACFSQKAIADKKVRVLHNRPGRFHIHVENKNIDLDVFVDIIERKFLTNIDINKMFNRKFDILKII